jgi:Flp pilus assembly protein TadD
LTAESFIAENPRDQGTGRRLGMTEAETDEPTEQRSDPVQEAQARLDDGDFQGARDIATEALAQTPDDVALLRVKARAAIELEEAGVTETLERIAKLAPDDARSWRDLGDGLAAQGRMESSADAFRKVLELDPADESALTHLGHAAYASGDKDEAVSFLSRASQQSRGQSSAAISLVAMYRAMGETREALTVAKQVADAAPDDVPAVLDVADLSVEAGDLEGAVAAFGRLREIDTVPGNEVYAIHGMIEAEAARESWDRALELSREACAIDPRGRASVVLAFLEDQAGEGSGDAPSREEFDAALKQSRAEYRGMHAQDPDGLIGSFGLSDELLAGDYDGADEFDFE